MNICASKEEFKIIEYKADWDHISSRKELIIQGFLSIGEKDDKSLKDGGNCEVSLRFNRYTLNRFWERHSVVYSEYNDIFQRTLNMFSSRIYQQHVPRMLLDHSIQGWVEHYVPRLVGNIASKYRENGPFFEILINSQVKFPFKISILENRKVAEKRHGQLKAVSCMTQKYAIELFFSPDATTPKKFFLDYHKQFGTEPGPNAARLLKALSYLNSKKMSPQIVGNCWAKQAKRIPLVSLFVETVSSRPELTTGQAWKLSQKLYHYWKKEYLSLIEEMVNSKGINPRLISIANRKIEHLKNK